MSTYRIEARVSALEHRQTSLEIHTEELMQALTNDINTTLKQVSHDINVLSHDMSASFDKLAEYQIQTEQQIDARFNKIEGDIIGLKEDVAQIKGDVTNIKATMATKEDIATIKNDMTAMEGRILDAFKQLLATINPQRPTAE